MKKKNNRIIHVIGLNSFDYQDLTLDVQKLLLQIKYIAAPDTFYNEVKNCLTKNITANKKFYSSKSNLQLIEWIKSLENDVILFSRGDPLWYGIGRILLKHFSKDELLFYPSRTCVQLAFSKIKRPWQDAKTLSIHGRDSDELINLLNKKEKSIAILTDPKRNSLDLIRKNLRELKLENLYEFWLLEEIGSEKEKTRLISNKENLPEKISGLNLVVLTKKGITDQKILMPLFGIDDNMFETFYDRPNLITKKDIRIQLLADLELPEFGTLFDIGSGCGSIGLEALRLRPKIKLICIDKRLGSQLLVKENAKRLGVSPLKVIEGDVREYLNNYLKESLSNSNRIIIGGCNLETKLLVIKELNNFLNQDDIIVLPIIAYEALQQIHMIFQKLNYETNIRLIQTFKGLSISEGTRFEPNNPVFIIKAKKK